MVSRSRTVPASVVGCGGGFLRRFRCNLASIINLFSENIRCTAARTISRGPAPTGCVRAGFGSNSQFYPPRGPTGPLLSASARHRRGQAGAILRVWMKW